MSCGCGKLKEKAKDLKKEQVLAIAKKEQQAIGRIIVFFRCTDYDFTTLDQFSKDGKTAIEYFL
jgi:hypothetical protein